MPETTPSYLANTTTTTTTPPDQVEWGPVTTVVRPDYPTKGTIRELEETIKSMLNNPKYDRDALNECLFILDKLSCSLTAGTLRQSDAKKLMMEFTESIVEALFPENNRP